MECGSEWKPEGRKRGQPQIKTHFSKFLERHCSRGGVFVSRLYCDAAPGFRVRRYSTICQRWSSGNLLKEGIPRLRFPFVIFQKSVPSLCCRTTGSSKSAECFFSIPAPSRP